MEDSVWKVSRILLKYIKERATKGSIKIKTETHTHTK